MKKIYLTASLLLLATLCFAQNLKSKYYRDSTLVDSTNKAKGYTSSFSGGGTSNNYVPDVIPPSPNAASMGRFGDIALNLSSGLPNYPFHFIPLSNIILLYPLISNIVIQVLDLPKMGVFWDVDGRSMRAELLPVPKKERGTMRKLLMLLETKEVI